MANLWQFLGHTGRCIEQNYGPDQRDEQQDKTIHHIDSVFDAPGRGPVAEQIDKGPLVEYPHQQGKGYDQGRPAD